MENEKVVEVNMGKGILFALGGMVGGFGIWIAVIAFLGLGTGGAIGGFFAAIVGGLVAGGYQKGGGKPGAVGTILVMIMAIVGAFAAIYLGIAIYLNNEGVANSLSDAFDLMSTNRTLRGAVIQDSIISVGGAAIMAVVTMMGSKKEKKAKD